MKKIYFIYLFILTLSFIFVIYSQNPIVISLYVLFVFLSFFSVGMGMLAKIISISFYLFLFQRVAILIFFPDNFYFAGYQYQVSDSIPIMIYGLYYYVPLMAGCLLFEKKSTRYDNNYIDSNVVVASLWYFVIVIFMTIMNSNIYSVSSLNVSSTFLMFNKIWSHSSFVIVVLILYYRGILRRMLLAALISIKFIYTPSKTFALSVFLPIIFARERQNNKVNLLLYGVGLLLFVLLFLIADAIRTNAFDADLIMIKLANVVSFVSLRVGFNHDIAIFHNEILLQNHSGFNLLLSMINGYVPGELFQVDRILSGRDIYALDHGVSFEKIDAIGGGYNLGYFLFDQVYFGYYAPLFSLLMFYPVFYIYNNGNLVYKVMIMIFFFTIGNSESIIGVLKLMTNLLAFYLFSGAIRIMSDVMKQNRRYLPYK